MKIEDNIKTNSLSVKELFTRSFIIPDYQREYSREKEHLEKLRIDLFEEDEEDYFIGSMVLLKNKKNDSLDVVDWQQRLITLSLIVAAIAKYTDNLDIEEKDSEERKSTKRKAIRLLSKESEESQNSRDPIIKINRTSNLFYSHLIWIWEGKISAKKDEEKLLKKNLERVIKKIEEEVSQKINMSNKKEILRYLNSLIFRLNRVYLIEIIVSDEESAYNIFEVLNDRWLELNTADLLKNLLLKQATKDVSREIYRIRNDMLVLLEDRKLKVITYIRHFWISRFEVVSEKKLYTSIKNEVSSYKDNDLIDFAKNLFDSSSNYIQLLKPSPNDFSKYNKGKEIYHWLYSLASFWVKQCYPLLLSLFNKLNNKIIKEKDFVYYLDVIEKFTFLFNRSWLSPSKIDWIYSEYAIKLYPVEKENDIKKVMSSMIKEFKDLIKNVSILNLFDSLVYGKNKDNKSIVYVLETIERLRSKELLIYGNSIEHIYAKSLSKKFAKKHNLSEEDAGKYLHKIGNLTILNREDNNKLGNEEIFSKKKYIYQESTLNITNELSHYHTWDKEEIEKREKDFFKLFSEIRNLSNFN